MSKTESLSNGENVSPPNKSMNSVSNGKILSKSENLSNPENLKTTFKNLSNKSALSKTEALSNGEKCVKTQYVSEFRVKLQNSLKKRKPVKPRKPKNHF